MAVLSAEVNEMGSKANFDAVQKRKKQRTKNNLKKLLLFLLIAAFCGYLYLQRDAWIPKLEGIGTRYESVITQNDGTLADRAGRSQYKDKSYSYILLMFIYLII